MVQVAWLTFRCLPRILASEFSTLTCRSWVSFLASLSSHRPVLKMVFLMPTTRPGVPITTGAFWTVYPGHWLARSAACSPRLSFSGPLDPLLLAPRCRSLQNDNRLCIPHSYHQVGSPCFESLFGMHWSNRITAFTPLYPTLLIVLSFYHRFLLSYPQLHCSCPDQYVEESIMSGFLQVPFIVTTCR